MVQNIKEKGNRPKNRDASRLVSVIMPVLNGGRTIAGAINSILNQTHETWELIIVDDGSQDNTKAEIQKFKDKRIKYFYQDHLGIVAARNRGNEEAKGEYRVVQDADDYSLPDRLEKIVYAFKETKADVIVHGIYVNAWNHQYSCMSRTYAKPDLEALKNKINGVPAYRRRVWKQRPFREETKHAYDWMMHLDWVLSGFKYAKLDIGLYDYIRYQGSASDRFEKSGLRAEAFKKIKEILRNEYQIKD